MVFKLHTSAQIRRKIFQKLNSTQGTWSPKGFQLQNSTQFFSKNSTRRRVFEAWRDFNYKTRRNFFSKMTIWKAQLNARYLNCIPRRRVDPRYLNYIPRRQFDARFFKNSIRHKVILQILNHYLTKQIANLNFLIQRIVARWSRCMPRFCEWFTFVIDSWLNSSLSFSYLLTLLINNYSKYILHGLWPCWKIWPEKFNKSPKLMFLACLNNFEILWSFVIFPIFQKKKSEKSSCHDFSAPRRLPNTTADLDAIPTHQRKNFDAIPTQTQKFDASGLPTSLNATIASVRCVEIAFALIFSFCQRAIPGFPICLNLFCGDYLSGVVGVF